MSVAADARTIGVEQLVHFTTDVGLLGMMRVGAVLSRNRLPQEQWLEFILKVNAETRWDTPWFDYVNLSVGEINASMFGASYRWHAHEQGRWWCVLAFEPDILDHDGVYFCTTNNGYTRNVRRGQGLAAFRAMFESPIGGRVGEVTYRSPSRPRHLTTDPQAEILYPNALPLQHLKCAYVSTEDEADYFESLCAEFRRPDLADRAVVDPAVFGGPR